MCLVLLTRDSFMLCYICVIYVFCLLFVLEAIDRKDSFPI